MLIKITYSPVAAEQIASLKAKGEAKPEKPVGKLWKAVRHALVEYLPEHGLNPSHIKSEDLSGIRARHVGDRTRIVWIASPEKNAIVVLMLGEVKEGDKHDTYAVLARELRRGTFDTAFAELEVPKPGESAPPPKRVETLPPPADGAADGGLTDGAPAEPPASEDEVAPAPIPPDAKPTSGAQPLSLR